MISYKNSLDNITPEMLQGFFTGWKNFPSQGNFLKLLKNSQYKIIAIDEEKNKVVGFINAISDNVLTAYIPLLEVLPEYQHRCIGSELVKRMIEKLKDFYMVDVVCDESVQGFYEKFGMKKHSAMIRRNFSMQKGK